MKTTCPRDRDNLPSPAGGRGVGGEGLRIANGPDCIPFRRGLPSPGDFVATLSRKRERGAWVATLSGTWERGARRARFRPNRRGAAIYIAVLGTAMLVALLGLSALLAKRVERRLAQDARDTAEARLYAQAAVEMGLLRIKNNSAWRTSFPNGVWEANQPIGSGTYTLQGVDPTDADLIDSADDPVVFTGIGVKGQATQKTQVTLVPYEPPLEALNTCLHAGDKIDLWLI